MDMRVKPITEVRGRHQGPAEERIACGIPVHHLHQTRYTQSVSLHRHYFRLRNTATVTRCRVRTGTATGWIPAPKRPVAGTAWGAEPRPVWWPQAVLTHCSPSGSNTGTSFCSPNTPKLTDGSCGRFLTFLHLLWTLLSIRKQEQFLYNLVLKYP